jgi:membrane-bound ClpP family serine protease
VLPVNLAGLLLLALAAALFIAELFAPGIGVFAGGGTIALLIRKSTVSRQAAAPGGAQRSRVQAELIGAVRRRVGA